MPNPDLLNSEIQNVVDELSRLRVPDDIPQQLYHYTDAKGLLGILESKVLWATDIRYLNDSMELRYGSDLISEVIN